MVATHYDVRQRPQLPVVNFFVMEADAAGTGDLFARPIQINDLSDCAFYHAMDVPGYGAVDGPWDLRPATDAYLGNVDFAGKRVLELGTTDGYLTFCIEQRGGSVISHDLSESDPWDIVPFARLRHARLATGVGNVGPAASDKTGPSWVTDSTVDPRATMRKLNNAYWLNHAAFDSRASLIQSDIYSVPRAIGPVDVTIFGAILLHTSNPFLALVRNLEFTAETAVITEALGYLRMPGPLRFARSKLPPQLRRPVMRFFPDWRSGTGEDGWWRLTPEVVQAFLGVLGFENTEVSTHFQLYKGVKKRLFTVVGHRTVPIAYHDQDGAEPGEGVL